MARRAPSDRKVLNASSIRTDFEVRLICGRRETPRQRDVGKEEREEDATTGEKQPYARGDAHGVDRAIPDSVEPKEIGIDVFADIEDNVEEDQQSAENRPEPPATEPRQLEAALRYAEDHWWWPKVP